MLKALFVPLFRFSVHWKKKKEEVGDSELRFRDTGGISAHFGLTEQPQEIITPCKQVS